MQAFFISEVYLTNLAVPIQKVLAHQDLRINLGMEITS